MSFVVCASIVSTTCLAADAETSLVEASTETERTIEGDSTVKSSIYNVMVSITVEFGIDVFEQAGQKNL